MSHPLPKVSVLMRSFNDIGYIRDTLSMLYKQTFQDFELFNTDSGSTDGTFDVIREYNPAALQIRSQDYVPGPVLNAMAQRARGEFLVFLNSDATPQNEHWLERLIAPFHKSSTIAATFGRQVPRSDAHPLVVRDYLWTFGEKTAPANLSQFSSDSGRQSSFFSLANAAMRRVLWEVYPFHAKLQYAEDAEWAKWARESGYEVYYVPEAVAVHSHNYTTPQIWKRFYQDARAIGQTAIVPDPKKKFFRGVIFQLVTAVIRDVHFGLQQRSFVAITSSPLVRVSQKCAEYFGYRQGFSERALYERPK